jgi:hypothetical protein
MRREIRGILKWIPLVLVLSLFPLTACDDEELTGPGDGMTNLSVYLTDQPGEVNAVWVQILQISLHGDEEGTIDLLEDPTELILLTELVGTVEPLVQNEEVSASTYNQLRFLVGDVVLLSTEPKLYLKGEPDLSSLDFASLDPPVDPDELDQGTLQCPSCSQSGLKVKIPNGEVELEEGATAMVLDFDVAQSFGHKAGNSGKWIMHPVIHGTLVADADGDGSVTDDLGTGTAIQGTVALGETNPITIPECGGGARSIQDFIPTAMAQVLVDDEGLPLVSTGVVGEDGSFRINFLEPDTYTMGVAPLNLGDFELVFTALAEPAQVTLAEGEVKEVSYTIQTAVCNQL